MRILLVSAGPPWRLSDGGSLVLHHHLRHLAGRHDITLLSAGARTTEQRVPGGISALPDGVEARWFGTALPRSIDYAARVVRSQIGGEPAHVFWVERSRLIRALARELATRPPDILHLFGWGTAQLCRLAGDVPTVHVAVDAWTQAMRNRLLPPWRTLTDAGQQRRVEAHERRHYPRCGAVVVVSPRDAGFLRRLAPAARVEVVPTGVEPGPEPAPPPDRPVIGFHGNLETRANVDAAVALVCDVFPLIRARRPDARVLLIGRNPPPEVRRLASDAVVVTGTVPDVREALLTASVYVAPMATGTGMKHKVLEAMAAGRPVVATPLALDGIGEGDGVLQADTPEATADAVVRLLSESHARRDLGRAARQRVLAEFSWERSAAKIGALWEGLSRSGGGRA